MKLKQYDYIDPIEFQNLIVDLYNEKENTNTYTVFGRHGQRQHGIDVYSPETLTAIQCKFKNGNQSPIVVRNLLIKELEKEFLSFQKSGLPFKQFILVSTFSHDAEIQKVAFRLSEKYGKAINYIGWDVIKTYLIKHPSLVNKYFGPFDINKNSINMVSYQIDETLCDWTNDIDDGNTFKRNRNLHPNPFPVFDFRFVNNTDISIILNKIFVRAKARPAISGLPQSGILKSSITYKLPIRVNGRYNEFRLSEPLYALPKMPFRFHVELAKKLYQSDKYGTFSGTYDLDFVFEFNKKDRRRTPILTIY